MDRDCSWICDNCNTYMNDQPGFDVSDGTWTCTECGALNDVSENNVVDILGMIAKGITKFTTRPLETPDEDD